VSELRSAIESYGSVDPVSLPDARLEEDLVEVQRAIERLELVRLRLLSEVDRRGLYERDGHLSTAAWVVSRFRVAWAQAREAVRTARGLREMARTRDAAEEGEVSLSALRLLATAREAEPEAFAAAEETLVEAARHLPISELQRAVAHFRRLAEHDRLAGASEEALRARRRLHASVTLAGWVRVDGDLDPETGETLLTALAAELDAQARSRTEDDTRTPAQRRADALGEICRRFLDRPDRPSLGGERPHVTVTVPLGALAAGALGGGPGIAELDRTGPVDAPTARRLACDAAIRRVVLKGRSEPLDVGRRTPVVPPGLRRAVIVRDRGCRFPGCDRPHPWCDAHHVRHWADGGGTSLKNLLLLCRRHHRLVHARGGFTLGIEDGRPVFRRPDGSVLADRAPP
jgi:hypothetical protein